jgi:predicted metalloprotease with PDZ domain
LSVALSHELFHLWVPNGLALSGDYDWFYEGFTIYQAALVGVRLGFLTFQEFLNAIARAYDSYVASADRDQWSLIEASHRRWTTGRSTVYDEGMVLAFLYDLKLREGSRSKRSLENVYQELFRTHRSPSSRARGMMLTQADGNDVIMETLSREFGMKEFVADSIGKARRISLSEGLLNSGLVAESFGARTRISVSGSLTRQQRDLLSDLGYNDSVRSRSRK